MSITSNLIFPIAIGYCTGNFLDQALANTLGLATLRHGINPVSWLSIRKYGFKPEFGNSKFGADYKTGDETLRVSRVYLTHNNAKNLASFIPVDVLVRVFPFIFSFKSTYNLIVHHRFDDKILQTMKPLIGLVSLISAAILPTLKVHLSQKDLDKMKKDPLIPEFAVYTDKVILPQNIGLRGLFYHAFSIETHKRISENKTRVLSGIFQLVIVGSLLRQAGLSNTMCAKKHIELVLKPVF